jgi:hypothetical protein
MDKKSHDLEPGSGINNPDHISSSLRNHFLGVKILKNSLMLIRDGKIRIRDGKNVGSGIRINIPGLKYLNSLMGIRDPGWEEFGSRMEKSRIRDPDPQHCLFDM